MPWPIETENDSFARRAVENYFTWAPSRLCNALSPFEKIGSHILVEFNNCLKSSSLLC